MKVSVLSAAVVAVLGMAATSMAVSTPVADYEYENNFNDSSGNGNHASLTSGTVTFMDSTWNFTRAGQWPSNVSAPQDSVEAPANVGSADMYGGGQMDLTVAFLVNPANVPGHDNNHWICWKVDETNNTGWAIRIDMTTVPARPYFHYWDERERSVRGDNLTEYDKWQHWTLVWHTGAGPGTGDYEWYYNGQKVDQGSGTNDNVFASPGITLKIGSKGNSSEADEDLAGGLDCLKVWHEALSATDVWQVYKASLPPCATTVEPPSLPDPTVTAMVGQVGSPNPVQLEVRDMGQNPVNWSVSVVGGQPAWITSIVPQNGLFATEPWPNASGKTTVSVNIDASGQSAGDYSATLRFTNDCVPAQDPIDDRVITLRVDACNFTALPDSIESLPGAGCPGSQNHDITVTNTTPTGGASVTYSLVEVDRNGVVTDVPWLSTNKTGGQNIPPGGTDVVTATVNYSLLEVGRNAAKLRFTCTCDPYEVHDVEIIAPFILNYQGNVDPEAANAGGTGLKFTEKEGDSADADVYRNAVPPNLVVEEDPAAVDGYSLHIADGPTTKLKLRTTPSQNIGSNTGATIVGRGRCPFQWGTAGENLSIWNDGGNSVELHWSGSGSENGTPGCIKDIAHTAQGAQVCFAGRTPEWYAAYHTLRGCAGEVGGSRTVEVYFDEKPTPVIRITDATSSANSPDSIGLATGSTAGQQIINFDWVTGTNAGMFGPGKEVACIGRSLCLGPDSACNPCHDPFADADGDHDVDQQDFAVLQICTTGSTGPVPADPEYCFCFDQRDAAGNQPVQNDNVDEFDAIAFENCASGPNVLADPACDD